MEPGVFPPTGSEIQRRRQKDKEIGLLELDFFTPPVRLLF